MFYKLLYDLKEYVCDLFALCAISIHNEIKRQGDVAMLPILPLKAVCMPGEQLNVEITENRYQKLIERCIKNTGELAVVFCSDYKDELGALRNVGCLAKITHCNVCSSGIFEVVLEGVKRFKFNNTEPKLDIYYASDVCFLDDIVDISEHDLLLKDVEEAYGVYIRKLSSFDKELLPEVIKSEIGFDGIYKLLNDISMPWEKKQQGVEINSIKKRFEHILSCLQFEVDMLSFVIDKSAENELTLKSAQTLN